MTDVERVQAWLDCILAVATDAIISIDARQQITLFNAGAEQLFGYSRGEIIGQPLAVLLPPRFRTQHADRIRAFAKSDVAARRMGERQAIWACHKDGHEFPAEASISKLPVGDSFIFAVLLRDVSVQQQTERHLEQRIGARTAELAAMLDAVPDGLLTAGPDRRIVMVNETLARLFGYERDEMLQMSASDLYASSADELRVQAAWREWEGEGTKRAIVVTCKRKDASTFPALVHASPVREGGAIVSRVAVIRDMTAELHRERVLKQAQRMEIFGQLTGGIAHDFNNLLTVIGGNQELLEMSLEDQRHREILKRAQEATAMGARLTGRLLGFARQRQLEPTELNLNEQILGMLELLGRSIGEQISLVTKLEPQLWTVRADASEIENAILNLAINARDAMPDGGALILETAKIPAEGLQLHDSSRLRPGDFVRLTISDTGVGMSRDVLQRAFEPFFTTKAPGKGTGLGLSTILGFVEQSGGTIDVHSEPYKGTTFNIYLPRAGDGASLQMTDEAQARTLLEAGAETVLLVEDNPEVRRLGKERLQRLGYQVVIAETGVEAVELLSRQGDDIDLVFSDVVMPGGVTGFELAAWVESHAPRIKVLLTSGFPGETMSKAMSDAGPAVLRKPYGIGELATALRRLQQP